MVFKMTLTMIWKVRIFSVFLLGLVCFFTGAECKRSACWRYGHVCWGGHGKRSGPPFPRAALSGTSSADYENSNIFSAQPGFYPVVPSPLWSSHPRQTIPIVTKLSKNRQQLLNLLNMEKQREPPVVTQSHPPLPILRQWSPGLALRQVELQKLQHGSEAGVDRNTLDDALVIPDVMLSSAASGSRIAPITSKQSLAAALKRKSDDSQGSAPGGTEEPLETSANGLDSEDDSGSVATFFRDRKLVSRLPSKDSDKERYSSTNTNNGNAKRMLNSARNQLLRNTFENLPMSVYSRGEKNTLPQMQFYYKLK